LDSFSVHIAQQIRDTDILVAPMIGLVARQDNVLDMNNATNEFVDALLALIIIHVQPTEGQEKTLVEGITATLSVVVHCRTAATAVDVVPKEPFEIMRVVNRTVVSNRPPAAPQKGAVALDAPHLVAPRDFEDTYRAARTRLGITHNHRGGFNMLRLALFMIGGVLMTSLAYRLVTHGAAVARERDKSTTSTGDARLDEDFFGWCGATTGTTSRSPERSDPLTRPRQFGVYIAAQVAVFFHTHDSFLAGKKLVDIQLDLSPLSLPTRILHIVRHVGELFLEQEARSPLTVGPTKCLVHHG